MIHTLTLNTAIDMNIFCDPLQPAAVNRTRQTEYCPNGKGVNVSLVLHQLPAANPCHGHIRRFYRPLYR
ncbi:tagatose-1-phosphate kinase TagK [Klebsiella pneumoniae]|uniref:Tagatose-1-phosphate kinase TagK n=1 Tax=Klebsiella pneumoniae TaxID=573 RepID=A0A378B451_KLEPN|nr:tagatose-1-phosphate kinase TagK [Klebsiella pneumoniae]